MPNLTFLAPTVPEIWRGSQNFKSRSRGPFLTCKRGVAGDPIFGFLDFDLPISQLPNLCTGIRTIDLLAATH